MNLWNKLILLVLVLACLLEQVMSAPKKGKAPAKKPAPKAKGGKKSKKEEEEE
jgi:hypothetical protein